MFTNRCLPYCFLQCFLKASVTTYQKQEVLAEKCPPLGKPVTFYECHPEDHAPAPSVRADFSRANMGKYGKLWEHDDNPLELYFLRHTHMAKMNSRQRTALKAEAPAMFLPEQLQALLMD